MSKFLAREGKRTGKSLARFVKYGLPLITAASSASNAEKERTHTIGCVTSAGRKRTKKVN